MAERVNYRGSIAHALLCEALTEAREKAGMKQAAVSAALKRPRIFCHLVEHQRRMLSAVELIPYCAVLQTSASAVLADVERRMLLKRSPLRPKR